VRHAALKLSLEEARGLMLSAQGLLDPPPVAPGPTDLEQLVDRLGVVQLDAINVVCRTQYLVPWSRLGVYRRSDFDSLLSPRRTIFEYWSHAASIVPMTEYRYYRPRMIAAGERIRRDYADWLEQNPGVLERTLDSIRELGPRTSAEFERGPGEKRTGPWDWYGPKASRRALEMLWTSGDLMIHSRRAGQKTYDVRERVLAEGQEAPPNDDDLPTSEEVTHRLVGRTLQALGVVTLSWTADYFRLPAPTSGARSRAAVVAPVFKDLVERGEAAPASIEGIAEPAYVDPRRMEDLQRLRSGLTPERTTLVSPFDSLIWHRPRARVLFGYEVCFEAYVVPEKRRYGYYCIAILHRGALVGRVDVRMARDEGALHARALYLEPGVEPTPVLTQDVAGSLLDLAAFLGAERVVVGRSEPDAFGPRLRDLLDGRPAPAGVENANGDVGTAPPERE